MRHTTLSAALTLGVGLLLTACTSDAPDQDAAQDAPADPAEASAATGVAAAGTPSESGWFCALVPQELVATLTGGEVDQARELMRANDEQSWRCQVNQVSDDGASFETVLELSAGPVDEQTEQAYRSDLQAQEGMTRGPEYLGEGYVTPGTVVALMECNTPPVDGTEGAPVPHAFVVEVVSGPGTGLTEELIPPLQNLITEVDRSVGCFPGAAYEQAPVEEG